MKSDTSPAARGYAMPAEWAPHAGTWFSWPHNPETWPGVLPRAEAALARAVHALRTGETVHLNVLDENHAAHVRSLLGPEHSGVEFHYTPTNDAWCRDHGAIFVLNPSSPDPCIALNWEFNAWGGKYPPFDLDNAVPGRMAKALGVPVISPGVVLEGGAIEVNGAGALLTTESCLLAASRNPHLKKAVIETYLRDFLGVRQVLWLPGGDVIGDDTDGHVDNLARFVNENTIVAPFTSDTGNPNYNVLRDNFDALRALHDEQENFFELVTLPVPDPVVFKGQQLPASYANFYIGNKVVLVPGFDQPGDALATQILAGFFPEREVISINCRDIVVGLGTLHCLSQQVPACKSARLRVNL